MEYITLNNGVKMPVLGYGVYQIEDLRECERCVLDAIEVGYRSDDMNKIAKLDKAESAFFSHRDPDVVELFAGLEE